MSVIEPFEAGATIGTQSHEPGRPAARDTHRGKLFRKYLLLILTLVSLALLVSGAISVYFTYRETTAALASLQREKAIGAASRIEQYLRQVTQQLQYAALPQMGAGDLELRRNEFLKLIRQAPEVTDISLIDADGRELIAESRLGMSVLASGRDRSGEAAFQQAKRGQPWFGPVYFRKETEPYMTVAIRSGGDKPLLTVAELNLKFIWDVVSRIKIGDKGKAYVVDRDGFLVADPDIGLVLRKTQMGGLEHVRDMSAASADEMPALQSHDLAGTRVLVSMAPIESLGWRVFVEQPVSEVYARLNASILWTAGLLLAGLAVSALAAGALARSMVRPIRTLDEGARRIGAGELEQRIVVRTGDELEGLADQFNRMTRQLRESYAGLERKVDERTAELRESLDHQTAISEVLRVISLSSTDVTPVFAAIMESARRLLGTGTAAVFRYDGRDVHLVATHGWSEAALRDAGRLYPGPPTPTMISGRAILDGRVQSVADVRADPDYDTATAQAGGWRRLIAAPMLKDGVAIGVIAVSWPEPAETPPRQVELLKTFADQAVIAIENVRLINETREALEQQTATAEVLNVISQSVADAQPVFEKILASCEQLFAADAMCLLLAGDDGQLTLGAQRNFPDEGLATMFPRPLHDSTTELAIARGDVLHYADALAATDIPAGTKRIVERLGTRAMAIAPLLWQHKGIGSIIIARRLPQPFSDKEIDQLRTFADQAVIAIQNARLFNETKAALERQTLTAEILKVIAGSPADVQPVFDAIVRNAAQLFEPCDATIVMHDDGWLHWRANNAGAWRQDKNDADLPRSVYPLPFDPVRSPSALAIAERRIIEVVDTEADGVPEFTRLASRRGGFRSAAFVPFVSEGRGLGVLILTSPNPGFSLVGERRALVATFADQAAISIQNVRLFREIQDKSRQLEIANQHKSEFLANMSHELRTPLNAIIGFSEVLIERMFGELNDKQDDYLKDIHSSGKHLLSLINDILDLSKIEAGRMELDVETFDVPAALSNALTLVRERAQRHGIALGLEVAPEIGEIRADERKFKQILLNLLTNAVKFTPDGGRVDVRARLADGVLEVAVADTGIGIALADQDAVFEEFKQVGRHYTNKQEGTGLGLALTKRFVELHGGTLRLDSEPGKGSTFIFTLPNQT